MVKALIITIVCMAIAAAPAQLACAASLIPAIKLDQSHYFMGKTAVTLTDTAIRIDNNARLKYVLIAKAPDWKITVFRYDDKTYFSESIERFKEEGLMSDMLIGRKDRIVQDEQSRHSTMKLNGFNIERMTSPWRTFKYMERGKIAAQVEAILYAAYKQPTNGGIPIYFSCLNTDVDYVTGMKAHSTFETTLETFKIGRVMVSPSIFVLGDGYKKARSMREVVAGDSARAESAAASELMRH